MEMQKFYLSNNKYAYWFSFYFLLQLFFLRGARYLLSHQRLRNLRFHNAMLFASRAGWFEARNYFRAYFILSPSIVVWKIRFCIVVNGINWRIECAQIKAYEKRDRIDRLTYQPKPIILSILVRSYLLVQYRTSSSSSSSLSRCMHFAFSTCISVESLSNVDFHISTNREKTTTIYISKMLWANKVPWCVYYCLKTHCTY